MSILEFASEVSALETPETDQETAPNTESSAATPEPAAAWRGQSIWGRQSFRWRPTSAEGADFAVFFSPPTVSINI